MRAPLFATVLLLLSVATPAFAAPEPPNCGVLPCCDLVCQVLRLIPDEVPALPPVECAPEALACEILRGLDGLCGTRISCEGLALP